LAQCIAASHWQNWKNSSGVLNRTYTVKEKTSYSFPTARNVVSLRTGAIRNLRIFREEAGGKGSHFPEQGMRKKPF